MTKVVIYTDFDGTVTKREGNNTITSDFFRSLLMKPGHYKTAPMKEPEECQKLFINKFGAYKEVFNGNKMDTDLLMSEDAVKFFHYALQNKEINVNIITKNRPDYIVALFRYQGFTDEEINNLTIEFSGYKKDDVLTDIWRYEVNEVDIYIMDDSKTDYDEMKKPTSKWDVARIHGGNEPVGQFKWDQYLDEIQQLLPNDNTVIQNNNNNNNVDNNALNTVTQNNNNNNSDSNALNLENQNRDELAWGSLSDEEKSNISIMTRKIRLPKCTSDYWADLPLAKRHELLAYSSITDLTLNEYNQININNLAIEINNQIDIYFSSRAKEENRYSIFKSQKSIDLWTSKMNVLTAAADVLSGLPKEHLKDKELSNPGWEEGTKALYLVNQVKSLKNIPLNWDESEQLKGDVSII